MQDVARKRRPVAIDPAEFPEWMHSLTGYDRLGAVVAGESVSLTYDDQPVVPADPAPGMWQVHLVGPNDPDGMEDMLDPLLLVAILAGGIAKIDERIEDLVAYSRTVGRSWTQIGAALGMSKQAAWERFSGED
jgi:hypothetical protein